MQRQRRARSVPAVAFVFVFSATACIDRSVGTADGGSQDDAARSTDGTSGASLDTGASPSTGDETGEAPEPTCTIEFGHSPGRALDATRWRNTVADLFGVDAHIEGPSWAQPFEYPVVSTGENDLHRYEEGAHLVAEQLDAEALLTCEGDATGPIADACIAQFASVYGRLAWRRALTVEELDALATSRSDEPAAERARAVVSTLLSAPPFWTIEESGTEDPLDPGTLVLDDHSIAARMAYFLWNSTPDAALLDLAELGMLSDPEIRESEASRMMADPRAARAIADYWDHVLDTVELHRSPKGFPEWDEALARAMREEVRRFVADVVLGEGDWTTLLTASHSFQNAQLASTVYAQDIVGSLPASTTHEPVQLDPERRPGLLTRAGVLARWSWIHEIGFDHRGLFVARGLLCSPVLPPPPDDVGFDLDLDFESLTRREAFDAYLGHAHCGTCHLFFTPITPGFDHYDTMGRWQTELTTTGAHASSGLPTHPVDPRGEIHFFGGEVTPFADHVELVNVLATSPAAHACVVRGQLSYALGRRLDDADACTLEHLEYAFAVSGENLRTLIDAIVGSEAFVRARP